MASFDIISLFPSVPIDLVKEAVTQSLLDNPSDISSGSIKTTFNNCLIKNTTVKFGTQPVITQFKETL